MIFKEIFPTPTEHTKWVNSCEYIVLHHTATVQGTTQGVLNGLNKRADYASCHYLVSDTGDIYKMGDDSDILWHAGVSEWKGKSNMNDYSIGIEVIGPLMNGGFTDESRKAVKELIQYLMDAHNIPIDNLVRHKDISPRRKTDISDTFWSNKFTSWADYKKSLITPLQSMTDYIKILEDEKKKKPGYIPIFSNYSDNTPMTAGQTKALIEIAFLRKSV